MLCTGKIKAHIKQLLTFLIVVFSTLPLFAQPAITSFAPSSGQVGTTVVIRGNNFNATATNNVVYFGAVRANVISATPTALTVSVPLRTTYSYITVTTNNLTAYSVQPFNVISGSSLTSTSYPTRWGFGVTGIYPSGLAVGDLDADGRPDLIGTNFNSGDLSIFKSTSYSGTVQVQSEMKWQTGIKPEGLALGDLNGDGKPDLVVTSIDDHLISIFINTSSGGTISFASRIDLGAGALNWPRGVAIGDLDGDGKPDLALADNNKLFSNNTSNGTISIYRNTSQPGTVSFAPAVAYATGEYPRKVFIGDLDGDSKADLAVTNSIPAGSVSVLRNNSTPGAISFGGRQDFATGGNPEQVILGDLNGDSKADMAASNLTSSTISVWKNTSSNGMISFTSKQDISATTPLGIDMGDVTGDGKPDLVAASYASGKVSIFQNTSSGSTLSFAAKMDYNSGSSPVQVSIGDMDGDGYPDISVTNSTINFISVLKMEAGRPLVNLGNDATLCQGDSLVLTANVPNGQYLWNTGVTQNTLTVKQSGSYWVKATSGGITVGDTIQVVFNAPPSFTFGRDTTLCEGQKMTLGPAVAGAAYLWQNGSATDSMVVDGPGTYWLQLQKSGCMANDTITVKYKPRPPLYLGRDTVLCPDNTVLLDAYHASIQSYTWQDHTTQPRITVQNAGNYWVKVQGWNGCFNSDTINIVNTPLSSFTLGKDTTLCDTKALTYNFNFSGANYLWSTGAASNSLSITQAGLYWLELSQEGCVKKDSVMVRFTPEPLVHLGNDTALCEGVTKILDAYYANATYLWNNGSSTPTINVTKPGRYWVAVNGNGCIVSDTIEINYLMLPHAPLKSDTTLCEGQTLVLNPKVNNASLLWQDGSTGTTYTVTQPGHYKVTITNQCETASDEITVERGVCQLFMPNAFTPNKDGLNDVFRVKYPGFIKTFEMQIFNRWGQRVFSTTDPYKGWDGKFNNNPQPQGNYVWTILLTDRNGISRQFKGNVLLLQ